MTHSLTRYLHACPGLNVLVLGDAILDSYLEGASSRLCPDAPVPVVAISSRRDAPGGAANTAVNVRALGAQVSFLSVVGDDAEADNLRRCLAPWSVCTDNLLVQPGRRTLAKHRVCAGRQILVRFDQGDIAPIDAPREAELIDRLSALYPCCDAVIVSDYGYGILTPAVLDALARLQERWPRVLAADYKRLRRFHSVGLTVAKPNYSEAMDLVGHSEPPLAQRADAIAAQEHDLFQTTGARIIAVTLDCDGAIVLERGRPAHRTSARSAAACTSGAGDTYLSALTLALAAGAETPAAADLAAAAAEVVVAREGTTPCTAADLHAHLLRRAGAVLNREWLAAELEEQRRHGKRIVFTNGCFDILHRGHVTYLRRAAELGDLLVIGVNTDEGIRRLKGPSRPINALEDRLTVLSALRFVDYLVPFDEDLPHNLVRLVRPHVFVKGGDYTRDRLPEASLVEELGGVVHILPLVEQRSTTSLIERIRGDVPAVTPLLNGQAIA